MIVRVVLEEKYVAVPNESTRMRMGIATREKRAIEKEWAGCVYCAARGERGVTCGSRLTLSKCNAALEREIF